MSDCGKSISDQTIGEAARCVFDLVMTSARAVVDHPSMATTQDWLIFVFAVIAALFLLGVLARAFTPRPFV